MSNVSIELPIEQQCTIWDQLLAAEKTAGRSLGPNVELLTGGAVNGYKVRAYKASLAFKTSDPDTIAIKQDAITLAAHDEPVLITGESGTGKELLANILHGTRHGPLVDVNVCSIVDTLFESELFGHARGSFTGADKERVGLLKMADEGTIFLDEIGDMPLSLQAKLLRVIQKRTFRKVGSNSDEPLRCRIVAATHQNLRQMIEEKRFRLDLYERLSTFKLHIRPLRERWGDAQLITNADTVMCIQDLRTKFQTAWEKDEANKYLKAPSFMSGNVRQLLNIALRMKVLGSSRITVEDIV